MIDCLAKSPLSQQSTVDVAWLAATARTIRSKYCMLSSPDLRAQAVFVLSMGPLVWAIVIWRNSLVFHSFDKVTSVFIHLLPALLLHGARFEACFSFCGRCSVLQLACRRGTIMVQCVVRRCRRVPFRTFVPLRPRQETPIVAWTAPLVFGCLLQCRFIWCLRLDFELPPF